MRTGRSRYVCWRVQLRFRAWVVVASDGGRVVSVLLFVRRVPIVLAIFLAALGCQVLSIQRTKQCKCRLIEEIQCW